MTDYDKKLIEDIVFEISRKSKIKDKSYSIPVGISNRHIHLTKDDLETLFGKGYELTVKSKVNQPGQYAANETVCISGPKGSFPNVRILGPVRKYAQVEISRTDAFTLGIKVPARNSTDTEDSGSVTVIGPKGMLILQNKVIVALRHVHMTQDDLNRYGVKNGDYVDMETENGDKSLIFKNVLVRSDGKSALELHIDTDEANAAEMRNGTFVRIYGMSR